MSYDQLVTKFNNVRLRRLSYYGLIAAIPREWKLWLSRQGILVDDIDINVMSTKDKIMGMDKVCRGTYFKFLNKHVETIRVGSQSGLRKWEEELNFNFDNDDGCSLFSNLYKCTTCMSLRAFQYFVMHRAIVTNTKLYKWKIKDSAACSFCKQHPESILHLLWECNITSTLWTEIFTWLNTVTDAFIVFSPHEILLGSGYDNMTLYDLVFMVAKKYIYACRCLGVLPVFPGFLSRLKRIYETETLAAKMYCKILKSERKWAPLAGALI